MKKFMFPFVIFLINFCQTNLCEEIFVLSDDSSIQKLTEKRLSHQKNAFCFHFIDNPTELKEGSKIIDIQKVDDSIYNVKYYLKESKGIRCIGNMGKMIISSNLESEKFDDQLMKIYLKAWCPVD